MQDCSDARMELAKERITMNDIERLKKMIIGA